MSSPPRVDLSEVVIGLQQQVRRLRETPPDLNSEQRQLWSQSLQHLIQGVEGLQQLQEDLGGEARLEPLQDQVLTPNGSAGIAIDISERRWIEDQLRRSESRLRTLIENLPCGVWAKDLDGILSLQNSNCVRMWGDSIGHRIAHPEGGQKQQLWEEEDLRAASGEVIISEDVINTGGKEQYFHKIIAPLYDGDQIEGTIGASFDVTERKQMEKELRVSEGRLRALIESFPFVVWAKDLEGRVTLQNSASTQLWGNWVGQNYHPNVQPEQLQIWQEEDRRAAAGEIVFAKDILTVDSHQRHFVKIIAPFYDGDQVEGVLGASFDITDQKQVEQALLLNERRLRTLVDTIPMGIWARDAEGRLILQNQRDKEIYGNIIDAGREALPISPQEKQLRLEMVQRAQQGETLYYETIERINNHPHYFLRMTTAFPDQDGKVGTMGTTLDITDRKRVEEDLRRSEERFRIVFEQAPVGVSQTAIDGSFLRINQKLCQLLGYSQDEITQFKVSDFILEDDIAINQEKTNQLRRGEIPFFSLEERIVRKDGQIRWVSVTVSLVRDDQNRPLFEIAIVEDITERKQLIQQKDEFLSTVSHELRTPLTSIQALLGLLTTGRLGSLTEPGQRLLGAAKADTDRLQRLVNALLNLERLKAERVQICKELFSIDILVAQVLQVMTPLATAAEILLESQIQTPIAWGDPDQVIQVLTNLLDNAIKFSPPGSTVSITVTCQWTHTLWQVKDQGIGITPDRLKIIFEPFQQGDPCDARPHSGSGLGLAICEQIIRQHQGRIWAENLPIGSLFTFTLSRPPDQIRGITPSAEF